MTQLATPADLSNLLQAPLHRELPFLLAITEEQAAEAQSKPGAWTRKQELGHLLDSALNNHIRFVRAALDGRYEGPGYAQNEWVDLHDWQHVPWNTLVASWQQHNALLVHLIARIPADRLDSPCSVRNAPPVTLRFLIEDYVLHMQHHLDHLLSRERITQYPGAQLGV
jgi:hypothetical protein